MNSEEHFDLHFSQESVAVCRLGIYLDPLSWRRMAAQEI